MIESTPGVSKSELWSDSVLVFDAFHQACQLRTHDSKTLNTMPVYRVLLIYRYGCIQRNDMFPIGQRIDRLQEVKVLLGQFAMAIEFIH